MTASAAPASSIKCWVEDFKQGRDETYAARGFRQSDQSSSSVIWPLAALVATGLVFAFAAGGSHAPPSPQSRPAATAPMTAPSDARRISLISDRSEQFHALVGFSGPRGRGQWRCLVDTGASVLSINQAQARQLGFDPSSLDYSIPMQTANGVTRDAAVTLPSMSIEGRLELRNVPTHVSSHEDESCLMGMSVLKLLRVAINSGSMELSW